MLGNSFFIQCVVLVRFSFHPGELEGSSLVWARVGVHGLMRTLIFRMGALVVSQERGCGGPRAPDFNVGLRSNDAAMRKARSFNSHGKHRTQSLQH